MFVDLIAVLLATISVHVLRFRAIELATVPFPMTGLVLLEPSAVGLHVGDRTPIDRITLCSGCPRIRNLLLSGAILQGNLQLIRPLSAVSYKI